MKHLLLTIFVFVVTASLAEARCIWEWDCSVNGAPCKQIPVCDSTLDLPPIKPLDLPPLPPIAPIAPIEPLVIPPIGTKQCHQAYLCTNDGRCNYQTVCQ